MITREPTYHQLKKQFPDKPEACLRCKLFTHCAEKNYNLGPVLVEGGNGRSVMIVEDTPPAVSVDLRKHYASLLKEIRPETWESVSIVVAWAVSCVFPQSKQNKDGQIPKKYIDACESFFHHALIYYEPEVIVTTGPAAKIAVNNLAGTDEIGEAEVIDVPYFHPEDDWQREKRDKRLIRVQNTFRRELVSVPDSDLEQVLRQAKDTGKIASDFEWAPSTGKLHTASFASKDFAWAGPITDSVWRTIKEVYGDPNMTVIGHDLARAEVVKLLESGVREINCKFRDGLIRTWELRGEDTKKAALKDIIWEDLDLEKYWEDGLDGDSKDERKEKYKQLMESPSRLVSKICRGDSFASMYYDIVLDMDFPEQVKALQDGGAEYWDHQMILPTAVMMWKGICVDEERVSKREKEIMKDLPRLKAKLKDEHGVDPNSPATILARLRGYGENVYNTREEVLKELQQTTSNAATDDLIETLLAYRNLNTVLTRYIQGLPSLLEADGRVRSYLQIAKAVTGRGASSNPNLENIPKHVRDIICSDRGELWTYDRSQSEYRCVAYLSEIETIIRDYMAGKDLHTFTAEFFDIPRKDAKNINFAGIFDATLEKLVYMLIKCGMEQDIARAKAAKFIETLLPVKKWQRQFVSQAYRQGYVETPTGRRSYRLRKQQIVNTPIQGWSADLNKRTVCEFFSEIWSRKLESYIWLEFHDGTELNVMPGEEHEIEDIASNVFSVLPDIYNKGIELPFPLDKEVHGKHWKRGE